MAFRNIAAGLARKWLKPDPLLDFRFQVEIEGLLFAGFTEVSGLSVEIETETYNEGGVNNFVHVLPKSVKYQNIVLKQGILYSDQMWTWLKDVKEGKITKRNGRILLYGTNQKPVWYWEFTDAYPVKWTGTDLKAAGNDVFIETLELSHCGLEKTPGT
jgi:phage tail-like protein